MKILISFLTQLCLIGAVLAAFGATILSGTGQAPDMWPWPVHLSLAIGACVALAVWRSRHTQTVRRGKTAKPPKWMQTILPDLRGALARRSFHCQCCHRNYPITQAAAFQVDHDTEEVYIERADEYRDIRVHTFGGLVCAACEPGTKNDSETSYYQIPR